MEIHNTGQSAVSTCIFFFFLNGDNNQYDGSFPFKHLFLSRDFNYLHVRKYQNNVFCY